MLPRDDHAALEVFGEAGAVRAAILEALAIRGVCIRSRHKAELQVRDLTEDALGLGRVLDTGQFHHDARAALALH